MTIEKIFEQFMRGRWKKLLSERKAESVINSLLEKSGKI
jgi:hypothetical protein